MGSVTSTEDSSPRAARIDRAGRQNARIHRLATAGIATVDDPIADHRRSVSLTSSVLGFLSLSALLVLPGCQNSSTTAIQSIAETAGVGSPKEALQVREGDVLKITVPEVPGLDTLQTVRRDGRITLPIVGEVQAAGLTPIQLRDELVRLYSPELVSKEVTVTLVASNFTAFVSGAVLRPGKIVSDRPMTVLQAIMEAGGFDFSKADLREVAVIRHDANGRARRYTVNVKRILDGKDSEPFFLQPSDVVHVSERFVLF